MKTWSMWRYEKLYLRVSGFYWMSNLIYYSPGESTKSLGEDLERSQFEYRKWSIFSLLRSVFFILYFHTIFTPHILCCWTGVPWLFQPEPKKSLLQLFNTLNTNISTAFAMTEVRHTALLPCQHTCRSHDLSDILPDKENLVFDTGIDEGIPCSWIKLSTMHHFNVRPLQSIL